MSQNEIPAGLAESIRSPTNPDPTDVPTSSVQDPSLATLLSSGLPVPVLCHETGIILYYLDDNTVSYLLELDPEGTVLTRIATQQRHPALQACKNDWSRLADTCPVVYLCAMLLRYIHVPKAQPESFSLALAQHDISDSIAHLYEQDTIDDKFLTHLTECLSLTCITESPALGRRPAVSIEAKKSLNTGRFFVDKSMLEELCYRCIEGVNGLPRVAVWRTVASYWQDTHRYIPTIQALWGVHETPTETLRRVVHNRTKASVSERELAKLDFLEASRLTALPMSSALAKVLSDTPIAKPAAKPQEHTSSNDSAQSNPLDAFAALAKLLAQA